MDFQFWIYFFSPHKLFYCFIDVHNKNCYDQINPRIESHTSNKIYMGHVPQKNATQIQHLLDYIHVNIDMCIINICQDCGKLGTL